MGMDHYCIIRQLGGTSGAFLAVDKQNEAKRVVIKRLADGIQGMQEVNASMRARHPNIIPYLESFVHDGGLYVVLQYAEGGDLESHLKRLSREKRTLPHVTLLRGFQQLIAALQCCHDLHIMHRDIKPSNVFVNTDASELFLGDFGSSKAMSGDAPLATTFVGSPIWLSPELLLGMPYGYASDLWSLGCVFYEMATQRRPFSSNSFAGLVRQITSGDIAPLPANVPEDIRAIIMSMLQTDPRKRCGLGKVMAMTEEAIRVRSATITQSTGGHCPSEGASVVQQRQQQPGQKCHEQPTRKVRRVSNAVGKVQGKDVEFRRPQDRRLQSPPQSGPGMEPQRAQRQRRQRPRQAQQAPIGHAARSSDSSGEGQLSEWIHARNNDVRFIESYLQKFRPADDMLMATEVVEGQEGFQGTRRCHAAPIKLSTVTAKGSTPPKGLVEGVKVVAVRSEGYDEQRLRGADHNGPAARCRRAAGHTQASSKRSSLAREPSPPPGFMRMKSCGSVCGSSSPLGPSPQREEERQQQRARREQERARMLKMIRERKAKAQRQRKARGKSEQGDDVSVEIVLPDHVRYFVPAA
uniref:non-specific serine/threonine protein kinase n=1 Tax=Trypanosoma congolense (strain IL3000) TaxID=1068625 RepID=G0URC1_TRYCI|nr:putative serine/threonine-protein kinase [Trypanosoma congolense IL3000]